MRVDPPHRRSEQKDTLVGSAALIEMATLLEKQASYDGLQSEQTHCFALFSIYLARVVCTWDHVRLG